MKKSFHHCFWIMGNFKKVFTILSISTFIILAALLTLAPSVALAADEATNEEMLERIEVLENALAALPALQEELQTLRQLLEQNSEATQQAEKRAVAAEVKAEAATEAVQSSQRKTYIPTLPDTVWHLAGYATAGAEFRTKADKNSFLSGKFNPAFHFQYKNILIFEAEMEIEVDENGETEIDLEYTQINLLLHKNITLVVGKYLSPIGQFQERLHPNWINKLSNAPAGFGHDGAQPEGDVGIQLRGGIPIGKRSVFTYVLTAGNGPRMGGEGNVEWEGFGADNNNNKAFGGRFGFLPVPYLEIGASYLKGKVDGIDGPGGLMPTTANAKVYGFDAAFTRGPWDVRFEYLKNTRDSINSLDEEDDEVVMMPTLTLKAWYVQVAYRLSGIGNSPFLKKLEPAFRYGKFIVKGNPHLEEQAHTRINVGLNYWIAPSAVARVGVEWRKFFEDDIIDETLFQLQISYGF